MDVGFVLWRIVDVAHVEAVLGLHPGRVLGLAAVHTVVTQGHALGTESIDKYIHHPPMGAIRAAPAALIPDLDQGLDLQNFADTDLGLTRDLRRLYPENVTGTGLGLTRDLRQSLNPENITGTGLGLTRDLRQGLDPRTVTGTDRF